MIKTRRHLYIFVLIINILALSLVGVLLKPQFQTLEAKSFDWRARFSVDKGVFADKFAQADNNIIIITIDDAALYEIGKNPHLGIVQYPWSRFIWANTIKFIEKGEPGVLAIDLLFSNFEDSTLSSSSADIVLADTLKKYDNIVLATSLFSPYSESNPTEQSDNPFRPIKSSLSLTNPAFGDTKTISYYSHSQIPNIFVDNSIIGVNNLTQENDGIIRFSQPIFKLLKDNKEFYLPSLPFAVMLKYLKFEDEIIVNKNKIQTGTNIIPLNSASRASINWHAGDDSSDGAYLQIPISKILLAAYHNSNSFEYNGKSYPISFFKDKIILVTKTFTNSELRNTSISKNIPVAQITANIIDNYINDSNYQNIMRRKFLKDLSAPITVFATLFGCLLIAFLTLKLKNSVLGVFCSSFLIFLYFIMSIYVFVEPSLRVNVPLVYPLYFMFLILAATLVYKLQKKELKKQAILSVYKKIVSQDVLEKLLKKTNTIDFSPSRKNLHIMYCQLSNLNFLSENYPSQIVLNKINQIYQEIIDTIFKYGGTIDRFCSNDLIAYWSHPLENEDDATRAVKSGLELCKRFNNHRRMEDEDQLSVGVKIALHTGEVLTGQAVTNRMTKCTIIGESIDIAMKIGSICETVEQDILMSETTYKQVMEDIEAQYAGSITVSKGEKLPLWAPLGSSIPQHKV